MPIKKIKVQNNSSENLETEGSVWKKANGIDDEFAISFSWIQIRNNSWWKNACVIFVNSTVVFYYRNLYI